MSSMLFLDQVIVSQLQGRVKLKVTKELTVTSAHVLTSLLAHAQIATQFPEGAHNEASPLMCVQDRILIQRIQTTAKAVMEGKTFLLLNRGGTSDGGG